MVQRGISHACTFNTAAGVGLWGNKTILMVMEHYLLTRVAECVNTGRKPDLIHIGSSWQICSMKPSRYRELLIYKAPDTSGGPSSYSRRNTTKIMHLIATFLRRTDDGKHGTVCSMSVVMFFLSFYMCVCVCVCVLFGGG